MANANTQECVRSFDEYCYYQRQENRTQYASFVSERSFCFGKMCTTRAAAATPALVFPNFSPVGFEWGVQKWMANKADAT